MFRFVRRRWFWTAVFSTALILFFSRSLLGSGMFFMHDNTHVARMAEMRLALESWHFPVGWSQNFGYGYGMPLFVFYGPLPFYLGVVITWLGVPYITTMKLLFILSGVLGFLGVLLWFKPKGMSVALPAATILLAAPYRALDIYVRGALNEVLALSLLSWVLLGALATTRSLRLGALITSTTVAAVLLTHNLTGLIGLPLIGFLGAAWLLIYAEKKIRSVATYAASAVMGAGMASFYSIPSVLEQKYTAIEAIFSGYFDYHIHFLYIRQLIWERWAYGGSSQGPEDGMSFHLGTPVLVALVCCAVIYLVQVRRVKNQPRSKRISALFSKNIVWLSLLLAVFGLSLFLTLSHAEPVWDTLPLISTVQFPWRFLIVSTVLGAILSGQVLSSIRKGWLRWAAATLFIVLALHQSAFHRPEELLESPDGLYTAEPAKIRTQVSSLLPDFIPATFDQTQQPIDPDQRIVMNSTSLTAERNQPHSLQFKAEQPQTGTITWNIADFPGWQYSVNGEYVEPELLPDGRRQFVSPETVSSVEAHFTATPIRVQTRWVSAAALTVWLAILIPWKKLNITGKIRYVTTQ